MLKKITLYTLLITTIIIFSIGNAYTEEKNFFLKGLIVDNETKEPLLNVYIKQKQSLNSVLTTIDGKFEIEMIKDYPLILICEKEGYEPIEFEIKKSLKEIKILLSPLTIYKSTVPEVHKDLNEKIPPILGSNFSAFYQIHHEFYSISSNFISGWGINEIGISGDIRFKKWLLKLKGFKNRIPVDVEGFPNQPTFNLDTIQTRVGLGYTRDLEPGVKELLIGGMLLYQRTVPDNKNSVDNKPIPYTNTFIDFGQNRILLGGEGTLGWRLDDRWVLSIGAGLYPGLTFYEDVKKGPDFNIMLDIPISLKYEVLSGIFLKLDYSNQLLLTNFTSINDSNYLGIGISIDPWRMALEELYGLW